MLPLPLCILYTVVLVNAANAQDYPFDRTRGQVPVVDINIVQHLDSIAPRLVGDTISVPSPAFYAMYGGCGLSSPIAQADVGDNVEYFDSYYVGGVGSVLGRVDLGPELVGYLLHVFGMYDVTVVDLWILDRDARRWWRPVELSDRWGDMGDYYYADALVVDVDSDGYMDIVKHGRQGYEFFDESPEVYFDTTVVYKVNADGMLPSAPAPLPLDSLLKAIPMYAECPP